MFCLKRHQQTHLQNGGTDYVPGIPSNSVSRVSALGGDEPSLVLLTLLVMARQLKLPPRFRLAEYCLFGFLSEFKAR